MVLHNYLSKGGLRKREAEAEAEADRERQRGRERKRKGGTATNYISFLWVSILCLDMHVG